MMRLLLLSDAASEHTQKWVTGLAGRGIEVGLFSFNYTTHRWFDGLEHVTLLYQPSHSTNSSSLFTKLGYLKYVRKVKKSIAEFKPQLVHAHYATSYGLVARMAAFHPFIISAWGTDVMRFPQQSRVNRNLLKKNLEEADAVCATSPTIRSYIHAVLQKEIKIIPFGVDTQHFRRTAKKELFPAGTVVIGCVKSLEAPYRIDVLIRAFALLREEIKEKKIGLLIVGGGSREQELKALCKELKLEDTVVFSGKIKHEEVPAYFSTIDVFANLSEYESFGVSVIEAMACENAVVVTDTGGLADIVNDPGLGARVPVADISATKDALKKYVLNDALRLETGRRARSEVAQHYSWDHCLDEMISVYEEVLNKTMHR